MKREGIRTLFIHSYLRALSCLLDHFCFVWKYALWWVLKVFLKNAFVLGKLCNDSCLYKNVYKVLVLKIVQRDNCFLKVFWKGVFFVMVLVSIRTRTKCYFENSSKGCLWNMFLKVILKRCLYNGSHFYKNAYKVLSFENVSKWKCWHIKFCCEQASN